MIRQLRAIYKQGVLLPLEPLQFREMQEVDLTISDSVPVDDLHGYFTLEEYTAAATDNVTWEDVRHALSGINGSLSDMVTSHRQEP